MHIILLQAVQGVPANTIFRVEDDGVLTLKASQFGDKNQYVAKTTADYRELIDAGYAREFDMEKEDINDYIENIL